MWMMSKQKLYWLNLGQPDLDENVCRLRRIPITRDRRLCLTVLLTALQPVGESKAPGVYWVWTDRGEELVGEESLVWVSRSSGRPITRPLLSSTDHRPLLLLLQPLAVERGWSGKGVAVGTPTGADHAHGQGGWKEEEGKREQVSKNRKGQDHDQNIRMEGWPWSN